MHERLDGPEVEANHETAEVAGDVGMTQQLRQLHLLLHVLQLLRREHLQVDVTDDCEELGRLVLGYQNVRQTEKPFA